MPADKGTCQSSASTQTAVELPSASLQSVVIEHSYSKREEPESRVKRLSKELDAARKKVKLLKEKTSRYKKKKSLESVAQTQLQQKQKSQAVLKEAVIQCKHIEVLHQLQEKESLNAANKLSRAHVEYHRQIMKVKLAAQTFSASVSKALEFASELSLPGFEGCLGTVQFIGMVNKAFDLLNSSSPIAKGFKAPLRPSTFHYKKEAMEQAGRELMALQLVTGKPLVQDSRHMSVISLVFTLKSVSHLAQVIFEADLCRYICTCRLNQDPIEMYFSCIRQRGGWNNNPSAAQFRQAYRRTLVHAQAASSRNANVLPQVQGICLPRSQGSITCTQAETTDCEESMSANTLSLLEHDYADISVFSSQLHQLFQKCLIRNSYLELAALGVAVPRRATGLRSTVVGM
ncbi:hypothetical protein HPB51_029338 [Rhipicephalus microplus]|uniref:Uncharacterized protein n=1 Tax=Rhipicephalus microplus TaxID=6941 RepID=A0A9J6CV11_RHIMP|nr:hypothetical protein HPB51_029338 [Rhipicephalus microplus]